MRNWAAVSAFLLYALLAQAQSAIQSPKCKGVIHGTVFDVNGLPAAGVRVRAWPLGVELGAMLPHTVTDEGGKYEFSNVCPGMYTVISDDEKVAYAHSSPEVNEFLYGTHVAEVRLTPRHLQAELPVYLPPKPGFLHLRVLNQETTQEVLQFSVHLKVPQQRELTEILINFDPGVHGHDIEVPPDKDVLLRVTSDGFRPWSGSASNGNVIRIASGGQLMLQVQLDPLK